MGVYGFDRWLVVSEHAGIWVYCLRRYQKTKDEMSEMTFDDLMAFVGAEEFAYAA